LLDEIRVRPAPGKNKGGFFGKAAFNYFGDRQQGIQPFFGGQTAHIEEDKFMVNAKPFPPFPVPEQGIESFYVYAPGPYPQVPVLFLEKLLHGMFGGRQNSVGRTVKPGQVLFQQGFENAQMKKPEVFAIIGMVTHHQG
jgi:hypothetical protein